MAAAATSMRSAFRTFRTTASKLNTTTASKPKPTFSLPKQNPLSSTRILRSPVELSCCVESLMPFHTATSSSLLISLISVSRQSCWLPEGIPSFYPSYLLFYLYIYISLFVL
ncbi:hypothetical protein IFM89_033580 [Coptis chinensis]|uniref:Protein NUCLEAR FUSION DEFECTIVE 6, chloroplastic/mitochondrial n=1 Tax=Coptis chinensis TaxID=261450 RepID=A0A835M5L8_9MAGN|nr:hypothetical protein IFM89_033580 [Coptis chinensis]